MSDPRDIDVLTDAHNRGWISREQGHYCFVQSQAQQCSPLDLALKLSYLTVDQVALLRGPQGLPPRNDAGVQGPKVGQVFDGYSIIKELGRGGMGAVFHGQKEGIDYALKLLLENNTDFERFSREAEVLAQVDKHPHIVRIHAYRQFGRHRYIVFDYLTGGNLKSRLKAETCFSEANALQLLSQLANGLAHVHSHHILHRDLKPENILFDEDNRPQISDFGLAYSVTLETLTKTGHAIGTPAYMAPEQIDNQHHELCPATDTWALGVILYELLSGEKPFEAMNAIQYAKKIVTQPTPRIRTLKPEISEITESLLLKALEKNAEDRFQSASEFEKACLAALETGSQSFSVPSLRKRARAWKRRVFTLAFFSLIFIVLYFYGQQIDDSLFDLRVSPELNAQSETIKKELDKSEKLLPRAIAQLLLRSSGLIFQEGQEALLLPKNRILLEDFNKYVQELESIPRYYQNSGLDRLRQQQSALSQYWSYQEALTKGEKIALNKRLSEYWRGFFRAYQLFLDQDYSHAKKRYLKLEEMTAPDSELRDLAQLGQSLCDAKRSEWRRAWKSSAKILAKPRNRHWIGKWRFHLNEQQALQLLFRSPNTQKSEREQQKDLEQCWSQLFARLANEDPVVIQRHWGSWSKQINKALRENNNRETIMRYVDFIARYWREKPAVIKPTLDHQALQMSLQNLFQLSAAKKRNDSHGVIFNHFLSIRQFDRSFKMDLSFLIQSKLRLAGILNKVETEIDWLESVTRLAHGNILEVQKKDKKRSSSFSTILFQTSLVASRQGVFLPLDQSVLLTLDKEKLLDRAVEESVDASDREGNEDLYPRFWRIQLNPFDFKKRSRQSQKQLIKLYKKMDYDIEYLLREKAKLHQRFIPLILRKKADWNCAAYFEILAGVVSEKDLGRSVSKHDAFACMEEAIQYPHFRPDKAHYDYARYLSPETPKKETVKQFERVLRELDKRRSRTLKRDFYVGRTLGEVILPVRDYKKEKVRCLLYYLSALKKGQFYSKAIEVASQALKLEVDKHAFERILAHCFTAQKRWVDLDKLFAKKQRKERQDMIADLFVEYKNDAHLTMELKKRYKLPQ